MGFVCLFVFFFVFFFFLVRIRGFASCYHLLGLPYVFFSFKLGLLSYLLFRIDVGLWVVGLLYYNIYIYFLKF